jgi:hypothetical protein
MNLLIVSLAVFAVSFWMVVLGYLIWKGKDRD